MRTSEKQSNMLLGLQNNVIKTNVKFLTVLINEITLDVPVWVPSTGVDRPQPMVISTPALGGILSRADLLIENQLYELDVEFTTTAASVQILNDDILGQNVILSTSGKIQFVAITTKLSFAIVGIGLTTVSRLVVKIL